MMTRILSVLFLAMTTALSADEKLKVLVVTGGHGFSREPFFRMFADNSEITFAEAKQGASAEAYDRPDLLTFDVVVLYDMIQKISDTQRANFLSLFETGTGLVVLHHALVSHQKWPEYERIIGGIYPESDDKKGVATPQVGYEHDVDIPVVIAARDHPVTAGLKDFILHDEIYWGYRVGADVTPLITTSHAKSGKPLGWTRTEKNSRVVFIQLGHGPEAFSDANYRRLLAQSIRWTSKKQARENWISLFDGKTLDGWIQRGGKAEYRVEDGQIVGSTVPNTPNSFLCTRRDYADFVLEVEFKVDAGLNSGVQIRSRCPDAEKEVQWKGKMVKAPAGRVYGLQVEIDPSSRAWSGGVHGEGGGGWFNDLKNNDDARNAFKPGEWNKLHIECRGDSIKTWINDVPATDMKDDMTMTGFIALQVHGVGNNPKKMEVRFRNIRLKELWSFMPDARSSRPAF